MKRGGGKNKGGQFERDLCRKLSLWLSEGKRNDLLWRSAGSGASATVATRKKKERTTGHGDIVSVHPESAWLVKYFVIEAKFYRDLHIDSDLIYGSERGIRKFWLVVKAIGKLTNKIPLLIVKQNGREPLCCLPSDFVSFLVTGSCGLILRRRHILVTSHQLGMCMSIVTLRRFMRINPKSLKRAANIRPTSKRQAS